MERWQQRFQKYEKALRDLADGVELANRREFLGLERLGLIRRFEHTHELAWNTMRDYYCAEGENNIQGSRSATRLAFKNGLIDDGEAWMG